MDCQIQKVRKETCFLSFGEGKASYTAEMGFTVRGEGVIAEFDEEGRIIGLELLSSESCPKPCQVPDDDLDGASTTVESSLAS